jgi:hypothetical protein
VGDINISEEVEDAIRQLEELKSLLDGLNDEDVVVTD